MPRRAPKLREKNVYTPGSPVPHRLSRYRIAMYDRCHACFYHYSRNGIPDMDFERGGNLYQVMDRRWKKEMDACATKRKPHPVMADHGLNVLPFRPSEFKGWRDTMEGITFLHQETNFLVQGIVDDLWIDLPTGKLRVVDYKTTTIEDPADMTEEQRAMMNQMKLQADLELWNEYKHQIEVYQWIFRQKQYDVMNTGHFVLAKVSEDTSSTRKLQFDHAIKDHEGDDRWVEKKLREIKDCLESNDFPASDPGCSLCSNFNFRVQKYQEKATANALQTMMQLQQQYQQWQIEHGK